MVWARIDDEILDNPKIARAGVLGFAMHIAAISWSCRNLTDGFVPFERVSALLDCSGVYTEAKNPSGRVASPVEAKQIPTLAPPDAHEIAARLVRVGLWDEVWDEDELTGYELHDFLQYNPSRAKVLRDRHAKSKTKQEAGRKGGLASGRSRRGSKPEADAKQGRSNGGSRDEAGGEANAKRKRTPVPDPVPIDLPPKAPPLGDEATAEASPAQGPEPGPEPEPPTPAESGARSRTLVPVTPGALDASTGELAGAILQLDTPLPARFREVLATLQQTMGVELPEGMAWAEFAGKRLHQPLAALLGDWQVHCVQLIRRAESANRRAVARATPRQGKPAMQPHNPKFDF